MVKQLLYLIIIFITLNIILEIFLSGTKLDKFTIEESYTLEDIQNDNYKILSLEDLIDLDTININEEMLFKIKNGQIIDYQTNKYILFR